MDPTAPLAPVSGAPPELQAKTEAELRRQLEELQNPKPTGAVLPVMPAQPGPGFPPAVAPQPVATPAAAPETPEDAEFRALAESFYLEFRTPSDVPIFVDPVDIAVVEANPQRTVCRLHPAGGGAPLAVMGDAVDVARRLQLARTARREYDAHLEAERSTTIARAFFQAIEEQQRKERDRYRDDHR